MNNLNLKKNDIIKMNGNTILNEEKKYFYVIISSGKPKILSASRSKTESKNEAIKILNTKINKIKSILESSNEIKLYKLTIRKVTKEEKEIHKNSSVDMIGGIIVITIDDLSILIKNNNLKLQSKDFPNSNSNMIYIDNKYLKKYNKVSDNIIKRISYKYSINEIEGGFTINRISHFN
jgi:hypothetical protein|tara:strand:- start:232 stop:765 length:534 start_codon:yes stop_codon:yes gene_type:complete